MFGKGSTRCSRAEMPHSAAKPIPKKTYPKSVRTTLLGSADSLALAPPARHSGTAYHHGTVWAAIRAYFKTHLAPYRAAEGSVVSVATRRASSLIRSL